jgi:hypothetical protein
MRGRREQAAEVPTSTANRRACSDSDDHIDANA